MWTRSISSSLASRAGNGVGQDSELAQTLADGLDTIGPLGMQRAANVIPVEGIDYELQPECLAGRRFARILRGLADVRVILRPLLHHRQQAFVGRDRFRALIGPGIRLCSHVEQRWIRIEKTVRRAVQNVEDLGRLLIVL